MLPLSKHLHHLFTLFSHVLKHHVWCLLWGWWQRRQHSLPPNLEHPPRTRAAAPCHCVRLGSWGCPMFTGWERSCTHTQSWAHSVGQELGYWFIAVGSGTCTCLFWHPILGRSPLFGMHRACLTRCCWIRRQPPLILPLSLPSCPKPHLIPQQPGCILGQEHSR